MGVASLSQGGVGVAFPSGWACGHGLTFFGWWLGVVSPPLGGGVGVASPSGWWSGRGPALWVVWVWPRRLWESVWAWPLPVGGGEGVASPSV